ncbi:putative methionine/alanine importer small subunit [Sediminihabitans luteus]|uniref:Putative methionine/alanine importer small subunit n=1 Tax=Sediminihabitans luteus TaxID=1138585 RepID=A0A2M9CD73_9CELL|nr:methionine/alanine import family NSS transporter small subunit [Sediminihabitans luteus]PJJ69300.1 putative methionine/alanine importer small subunit [Sediminihabitans luteus]GII98982.1 hypothetical protein Slu03_13600 [Sediminihabitans luteus]
MTTEAAIFLAVTILVVWGGLVASILFLRAHPESRRMPPGGEDDAAETAREAGGPVVHDT